MKIPLANQLKKRQQVEISILQDEMVRIVYNVSVESVLHGGTSVWRCYSGKRFSEDLDFYSTSFPELVDNFRSEISAAGLSITKMKDTGNVILSQIVCYAREIIDIVNIPYESSVSVCRNLLQYNLVG